MRRTDGSWMMFAESNAYRSYWTLLLPVFSGH